MHHLALLIEDLKQKDISFKSICNGDTTTASGELIFNIFSSLAQFERRLIQERTKVRLEAAHSKGRKGGRPKALTTEKLKKLKSLVKSKEFSVTEICKMVEISRSVYYRAITSNMEQKY